MYTTKHDPITEGTKLNTTATKYGVIIQLLFIQPSQSKLLSVRKYLRKYQLIIISTYFNAFNSCIKFNLIQFDLFDPIYKLAIIKQ